MAYDTRIADPTSDREAILGIWSGALEGASPRDEKYRAHYLECPWGNPTVELLEHDGVPVGVAAVQPRSMTQCGKRVEAGLLMDFAVAAAHRSVGPALRLQRSLLSRCDESCQLVYGLPNANARVLSARAGMIKLGDMTRFVKVLRYGRYMALYVPARFASRAGRFVDAVMFVLNWARLGGTGRRVATWVQDVDPELDELWTRTREIPWLLAPRDTSWLRWQLRSGGGRQVRLVLVRNHAGGRLEGWFACERTDDALKVVDYWTENAAHGPSRALLNALIRAAASAGCASISVELLVPKAVSSAWISAGFTERDSRPVFAKWSTSSMLQWSNPEVFMTSADEDE